MKAPQRPHSDSTVDPSPVGAAQAPLKAGDIVFSNNHLIAHAREAFTDGKKRRHMVRAWIQVAEADANDDKKY